MLFSIPLFIIILISAFYLPGRFLLRRIQYPQKDFLSIATMSFGVGIALFLIGTYMLSWLHISYLYNLFVLVTIFLEWKDSLEEWKKNFSLHYIFQLEFLIILLGSIGMVALVATSGITNSWGMVFYSANGVDSVYHISLINSIIQQFPPNNPSVSGVALHGYHILYDFLIAQLVSQYHFNTLDMFFRLFPVFMSIFYGFAGLTLVKFLKFTRQQSLLFLFLLYFAQGFRVILVTLLHAQGLHYDPVIVQSLSHVFDPSVVLSMGLTFLAIVGIFTMKKTITVVVPIILIGILGGMKIYTAILMYGGLAVIACYQLYKEKRYTYFLVLLGAGILSAFFYVPFNLGVGKLIFAPFLQYKHFMESNDIFYFLAWPLKYQVYELHHNVLRIVQLYLEAFVLFLIPSLGLRIVSLVTLPKLFHKKSINKITILFCTMIAIAFCIGSFFIQNIEVFNTVQFLWLGYILLIFPTAYVFGKYTVRSKKLCIAIWVFVILFSLPDTIFLLSSSFKNPTVLSSNFLQTASKLQQSTNLKDGIMVIDRKEGNDIYNTTFFSALSNRPIYYQTMVLNNVPEDIVSKRRITVDTLASLQMSCVDDSQHIKQILKEEKIDYLVSVNGDYCKNKVAFLQEIFSKGNYRIYQVM